MSGRSYYSCLIYLGRVFCFVTVLASCDSGELANGTVRPDHSLPDTAAPLDIAQALGSDNSLTLTVALKGSMVLPVATTRESASADIVFDRTSRRIYAVLRATLDQPLDVHIHEGSTGEVGAEVATLYADGGAYTLGDGVTLSARQAELLEAGNLYIDAHTAEFPNGLLRAQLTTTSIDVAVSPSLDDIQAKVFTPICSGCHNGNGQTLPGVMNLTSSERSRASLIGVYSINEPTLLRVEPSNPSDSLLIRKLEGTHEAGSRMPFRGSKLNEQTIASIRDWIVQGAAR